MFLAIVALLVTVTHLATGFRPEGQYSQAAVLVRDSIFVCGGYRLVDNLFTLNTNLYSLDVSQSWNTTNPLWADLTNNAGNFTVPLNSDYAMWPSADNVSFYIWGGGNPQNVSLLQSGFAQYSSITNTWSLPSAIASMPQQRRLMSAAWTSSGVAYMWGGVGDRFTGYSSDNITRHAFDDMITFDTKKLIWTVFNFTQKPTPRAEYTVTILRTGQMVYIGGVTMQQTNETTVTTELALMSDIPIFDTISTTWKQINATGVIPAQRYFHTAVLGSDDISIIICCGSNKNGAIFNDVAVLDTQTWIWTTPEVIGNAPSPRWGLSSAIVNGQMIVFFGEGNIPFNDVNVLDTRTKPFIWITSFSPTSPISLSSSPSPSPSSNSTDNTNGPAVSNGVITAMAVICGVLVVVIAILAFFFIRKRGQQRAQTKSPYASNMNQIQSSVPYSTSAGNVMPPIPPAQYGYNGLPGQSVYINHLNQQMDPYNSSNPVMPPTQPLQYSHAGMPGQPGYNNHAAPMSESRNGLSQAAPMSPRNGERDIPRDELHSPNEIDVGSGELHPPHEID